MGSTHIKRRFGFGPITTCGRIVHAVLIDLAVPQSTSPEVAYRLHIYHLRRPSRTYLYAGFAQRVSDVGVASVERGGLQLIVSRYILILSLTKEER
jgi:hypothetical protein